MNLNSVLAKREQLILQKFICAEQLRQEKQAIQEKLKKQRESPRMRHQMAYDRIAAL